MRRRQLLTALVVLAALALASAGMLLTRPHYESTPAPNVAPAAATVPATAREVSHACGVATKSGRPCQRSVIGEGACWQHR